MAKINKHAFTQGKDPYTRCAYCADKLHVSQVRWDWLNLLACDKCFDPRPGIFKPSPVILGELKPHPKGLPDYMNPDIPVD